MIDELNAAARIVAIVIDALAQIARSPPNSRAASDALDYLTDQVEAYRRAWHSSPTYKPTETYLVALMEAASGPTTCEKLLESDCRLESAHVLDS
ncbi:MAG: hypothetical protein HYX38_05010 [Rhodospirillales bacterium]|nr:hypothetical protein [Rhodospirillales bacterium]